MTDLLPIHGMKNWKQNKYHLNIYYTIFSF